MIEWMRNNGFIIVREKNILLRKNGGLQNDKTKVYMHYLITKLNENDISVYDSISEIGLILLAAIDTTTKSTESR